MEEKMKVLVMDPKQDNPRQTNRWQIMIPVKKHIGTWD